MDPGPHSATEIATTEGSCDRLSALTLQLQEEMEQLRQESFEMQTEYEAVQGSIIRELCR